MSLRALYDLPAPAKINAFLHVIGRRSDGYHLLQSVFVLIDWADTLHVELRGDRALLRHDLGAPLPADDLCLRAARLLQTASACTVGADISIVKRVPWGAGLGGGSSDAATTLLALNCLWQLHWPRSRLHALAQQLGADVPFFIGGRNAFVEGIGEKLTPIVWSQQLYAVLKPAASLATQAVFAHPQLVRNTEPVILSGSFDGVQGGFGRNDLQVAATDQCPEVAQATRWLEAQFGNSRMTGSGSAVFARAGTCGQPRATFPQESLPAGWVGRMCSSLERHPLFGWAED